MSRLTNKSVIVTGAGSGQGYATALAMHAEGANVFAVDVDERGLAKLAQAQPEIITRICDVTQSDDVRETILEAEEAFGGLDGLLNCAGILRPASLIETSDEDFDLQFNVNVRGVFYMCKYGIPALQRRGGGTIVNWGSTNAFVAEPDIAAYCGTKGAVLMLTKSIALEHGADNIRANCICPGAVKTPMVEGFFEEGFFDDLEQQRAFQPLGMADPEDVANVAVFLTSEDSRMMTGSAVMVDGGYTAQ